MSLESENPNLHPNVSRSRVYHSAFGPRIGKKKSDSVIVSTANDQKISELLATSDNQRYTAQGYDINCKQQPLVDQKYKDDFIDPKELVITCCCNKSRTSY